MSSVGIQTLNRPSFLTRLLKSKAERETGDYLQVPAGITLFHVTHWKAGSQWMRGILRDLFGPSVVEPQTYEAQILSQPIGSDKVYMCAYLSKVEFDTFVTPAAHRRFILIRDLRDTLVSAYFSMRYSHVIEDPVTNKWRTILTKMDQEQGLLYLTELWLQRCAVIHRTWMQGGERVFRLEDCMTGAVPTLTRMFEVGWGITVDRSRLEAVTAKHSFEKLAGGRERGTEDSKSHYRKGVHGDWQNYFTPAIKQRFKSLYNDVILMAGYEQNENW